MLSMARIAARAPDSPTFVVPPANAPEASLVSGLPLAAPATLAALVAGLRRGGLAAASVAIPDAAQPSDLLDLADVAGQAAAKRALEVAAAGVNRPDILQRRGLYAPPPGASPNIWACLSAV